MLEMRRHMVWLEEAVPLLEERLVELVSRCTEMLDDLPLPKTVQWVSAELPAAPVALFQGWNYQHVHEARALQLLGSSQSIVIYRPAAKSLSANVFAALGGCVATGGVFVLAIDKVPYANYLGFVRSSFDRFLTSFPQEFYSLADFDDAAEQLIESLDASRVKRAESSDREQFKNTKAGSLLVPLQEQQIFVEQTLALLSCPEREKLSVLLHAKRGRGKTTALGFLLREWLYSSSSNRAIICAPTRRQVAPIYQVLNIGREGIALDNMPQFFSVDHLLSKGVLFEDLQHTVLVIDEAASISLGLLTQLVDLSIPIVFATTSEGYEGSGRGFLLRYTEKLRKRSDNFIVHRFEKPLRWSVDDSIEPFIDYCAGFFSAQSLHGSEHGSDSNFALPSRDFVSARFSCDPLNAELITIRKISMRQLLENEVLLREVYTLLVDSHYQTRPSDLQRLLDGDGVHLWLAYYPANDDEAQQLLVGAMQVLEEGEFSARYSEGLAEQVALGNRRPPGNLVAQKLASHYCLPDWCELGSLRVSRIAVDYAYQRQGVGSRLIEALCHYIEQNDRWKFWSSSFGLYNDTLSFWLANGALLIHVGHKVDKASGEKSAIVIRQSAQNAESGESKCQIEFDDLLRQCESAFSFDRLALGDVRQVQQVVLPDRNLPASKSAKQLYELDIRRLQRLVAGTLDWDSCYPSFLRTIKRHPDITFPKDGEAISAATLVDIFFKHAPDWRACAEAAGLEGRHNLIKLVRKGLRASGQYWTA